MVRSSIKVNGSEPIRKRTPRNPEATYKAILEAGRTILAQKGPEALSLSAVAHLAGVNRGTAYQHFQTRENLVAATTKSVSHMLYDAVFGDPQTVNERTVETVDHAELTQKLADVAMQNPELCRIWLHTLLSSPDEDQDPFWDEFLGSMILFCETEYAAEKVDPLPMAVTVLAGTFLWPIYAQSHAPNESGQAALSQRYVREIMRLSMYGSMRPEKFPELAAKLNTSASVNS